MKVLICLLLIDGCHNILTDECYTFFIIDWWVWYGNLFRNINYWL